VEEGSFVMAAPGASHSYRAGGRDFKRLNVQVRRQCLERLLAEMREPGLELAPFDGRFAEFARKRKGGPVLDPTTFEAAVRIVSEMEGEWLEPKPGFAAKLRFMLGELLMLLARTLASNAVPEQDDAKRRLRDAIALVGREYARPIKMDELEAVAGLGRRSLERAFLKETGLAPKAFILKTRVAWACRLLADRGMRIQEAAEACGFSEQNYFTRVFKAYTGMTPGQFAKRKGGT
jgi:AraC-like DNA-binding protein